MSNSLIDREITQGVIPIGTPKAYKYDAALVEAAKVSVQQGMNQLRTDGNSIISQANTILAAIRNQGGYPLEAATASAMTDTTKIYVYTGSETGYTFGNWYYHNGTAWTDGGVYNAIAFNTDPTLTISGAAADAKVAGKKAGALLDVLLTEHTNGKNVGTFVKGRANNVDGYISINTAGTTWKYNTVSVQAGEIYEVQATVTGSSSVPYCIYTTDADDKVLRQLLPNTAPQGENAILTTNVLIEEGEAKIYVNILRNSDSYIKKLSSIYALDADMDTALSCLSQELVLNMTRGRVDAIVGQTITITETTAALHAIIDVTEGEIFFAIVSTTTFVNYPQYIAYTDDDDVVVALDGLSDGVAGIKIYKTVVPTGATKMYVQAYGTTNYTFTVGRFTKENVSKNIEDAYYNMLTDYAKELAIDGVKESVSHATNVGLSFGLITDTHSNGVFTSGDREEIVTGLDSTLSNDVFRNVINTTSVDFGIHCGDIISAYDITKEDYLKTLARYMYPYTNLQNPIFFVKGNHECNQEPNLSQEADLITPNEYFSAVQRNNTNGRVVNPADLTGGYYFVDYPVYRVRTIMLNAYRNNDDNGIEINFGSDQLDWLYHTALDLSALENADKWGVIVFCHPSASTTNAAKIIRAFTNKGTTVSGYVFPIGTPGTFIAWIHGHNHVDEYGNENNFNNIGVARGYARKGENASDRSCVDIFSVIPSVQGDNRNGIIYETRIGRGNSRAYSYGNTVEQLDVTEENP